MDSVLVQRGVIRDGRLKGGEWPAARAAQNRGEVTVVDAAPESRLGGMRWGQGGRRNRGFPQGPFPPFSPWLFSSSSSPHCLLSFDFLSLFSHPSLSIHLPFFSFPLLHFPFPWAMFLPSTVSPFPSPFPWLQSDIPFHHGRQG